MFGRQRTVERRCNACGSAWLLTSEQARLSSRGIRRSRGPRIGATSQINQGDRVPRGHLSGSKMAGDGHELRAVADALRTCPNCQSEDFSDRKVNRSQPASPGASRTELP